MRFRHTVSLAALLTAALFPSFAKADSISGNAFTVSYIVQSTSSSAPFNDGSASAVANGSTNPLPVIGRDIAYSLTGTTLTFTMLLSDSFLGAAFNGPVFTDLTQSLAGYSIAFDQASTDKAFASAAASISGSSISVNFQGLPITAGKTAIFDIIPPSAVTPEPSSFLLLATGLMGMGFFFRRRLFASAETAA